MKTIARVISCLTTILFWKDEVTRVPQMKWTAITVDILNIERLPGIPSLKKVPVTDTSRMMIQFLKRTLCEKSIEIPHRTIADILLEAPM